MSGATPIQTLDVLRAIASPVRIRLYELLVEHGTSTVSVLASGVGIPTGSVTHHLRALHEAGLVQEVASPTGDRREHWWRAVPGGLRWSAADFIGSAGNQEVATAAHQAMAQMRLTRLDRWLRGWARNDAAWVDAALDADMMLALSLEEFQEFVNDLVQVMRRWHQRAGVGNADTSPSIDARKVFLFLYAFPIEEDSG